MRAGEMAFPIGQCCGVEGVGIEVMAKARAGIVLADVRRPTRGHYNRHLGGGLLSALDFNLLLLPSSHSSPTNLLCGMFLEPVGEFAADTFDDRGEGTVEIY